MMPDLRKLSYNRSVYGALGVKGWPTQEGKPWDGFLAPRADMQPEIDPQMFAGKRVLITGAGGYIGSALVRALQTYRLGHLVLLDSAEHGLYRLGRDAAEAGNSTDPVLVVGNICEEGLVREVVDTYRPQIIFHAAALKHVPLMETNPIAAVATNVLGMSHVATAAAEFGAEHLVLLSTDKAVDPISIMGASKRLAELIVLANRSETKMTAVRLCNVLGSSGSVAPNFVRQIERGADMTVTHPEATRYFLSIEATVCLLLLAAARGSGTELVIPKLGAPSKIADLAKFLIARIGGTETKVVYTQLRRGDKLHESMMSTREKLREGNAGDALLSVESPALSPDQLAHTMIAIRESVMKRNRAQVLSAVREAVPEYAVYE